MALTVPDLVRAVVARAGLTPTYVEQRSRALQNAGLLPVAVGRATPAARPRDLVRLILALSADKVRLAPATVQRLGELQVPGPITAPPSQYWPGAAPDEPAPLPLERFLEGLVERIWSGNRSMRRVLITIDQTEARVAVASPEQSLSFHPRGTILAFECVDRVRRTFQVPAMVIAAIGADMGIKAVANAA